MEHLKQETVSGAQLNMDALYQICPQCFTESKDPKTGEIKHAVDFEKLRLLLGDNVAEGDERYDFTWVGKRAALQEAAKPIRKTLRPCPEESVDWENTKNLYIEGDNLEVLKLLQNSYMGKVKMIYIDPPYNTGNDSFVYSDDFSMDSEDYAIESGNVNEDGLKFRKNSASNGRYHSDWCSMIYSRLMISRSLLTDDGVIFISIDDNEVDNMKKICSEIFGESNFVGCAGRITKKANNQGDYWAPNFDYILTFTKDKSKCPSFMGGQNEKSYNLIETDGPRKGERYQLVRLYMSNLDPMRGCTNQRYYIECPDGTFIIPPGVNYPSIVEDGSYVTPQSGKDKIWRWSYQSYLEKKDQIVLKQGRSSNVVGVNGAETTWNAFTKTYLKDVIEKSTATPNSFIEEHINQLATHELKELDIPFSFPKPSSLIMYLANICRVNGGDIVLDFFSGSASTAHAVMKMNSAKGADDSMIQYIMVQWPEECDEDSDAFKAGYKNICEIGKERIRRAGKKIMDERKAKQIDLFSDEQKLLDIGFRVFKCADSNMKDVYYTPAEYTQELLFGLEDNIKDNRNDLDLLFGCMLDWGVTLDLPLRTEKVDGVTIHVVNNGDLIACFEHNISEAAIDHIASLLPMRVVLRDSCFKEAKEKMNFFEIFKQRTGWNEEEVRKNVKVI